MSDVNGVRFHHDVATIRGVYRCGYCQQTVLSTSGYSCGRTPRIRCDCGGIQQDGKKRLHSKYATALVLLLTELVC